MLLWYLFLQSSNTNLAPIFYKAQKLIWHLFTKVQILFLATTHKAQMLIWHLFYKTQVLPLAIFWKNPTKPKY